MAADYVRALQTEDVLELDPERLELLCDALIRHSDGKVTVDVPIQTCWNADPAQLSRVDAILDPTLISVDDPRARGLARGVRSFVVVRLAATLGTHRDRIMTNRP